MPCVYGMSRIAIRAMVAMGAVLVLTGCTGQATVGLPTAQSAAPPSASAAPGAQELQFVACMRQQGIADMPDPIPGDTSGRSSVRYALDVLGKGSDDAFQAALDTCQNLLPPAPAASPPSSAQKQTDLAFAACMRSHGLTDFPDDIPYDGGVPSMWFSDTPAAPYAIQVADNDIIVNLGNPTAKAAFDACQADWL